MQLQPADPRTGFAAVPLLGVALRANENSAATFIAKFAADAAGALLKQLGFGPVQFPQTAWVPPVLTINGGMVAHVLTSKHCPGIYVCFVDTIALQSRHVDGGRLCHYCTGVCNHWQPSKWIRACSPPQGSN